MMLHPRIKLAIMVVGALLFSGFVGYRALTQRDDLSNFMQREFSAMTVTPEQKRRLTSLLVVQGCIYAVQAVRESLAPTRAAFGNCGQTDRFTIRLSDDFIYLTIGGDAIVQGKTVPFVVTLKNYLSAPNVDEFGVIDVKINEIK